MHKHFADLDELQNLEHSLAINEWQQQHLQQSELSPDALRNEHARLQKLFNDKRKRIPDYLQKLVGSFEFRVYWFELFECFRKLMLVGAPVFFYPPGSVQQLIYGLMMCFTIASAFSYFKPYADAADTRLASLCQAQIFFSLLSSVLNTFEQSTLRLNHNVDILLVVLTLLPIGLAVYAESPLASYVGRQSVGRASPKVGPPTCKPPPLSGLAGGFTRGLSHDLVTDRV